MATIVIIGLALVILIIAGFAGILWPVVEFLLQVLCAVIGGGGGGGSSGGSSSGGSGFGGGNSGGGGASGDW